MRVGTLSICVLLLGAVVSMGCGEKTVVVPQPPVVVPQPDQPKFWEHFSGNQMTNGWINTRGQWLVQNEQFWQVRDDPKELNALTYYDPLLVADGEIEVQVTVRTTMPQYRVDADEATLQAKRRFAGAGLVFRVQNADNFYMFRLAGEEGAVFGKMINGEFVDISNPRAADFMTPSDKNFGGALLRLDVPYTLKVRTVGKTIQCFINDRAVVNTEDTTFTTGRTGITTFRAQAVFDDFKVWVR